MISSYHSVQCYTAVPGSEAPGWTRAGCGRRNGADRMTPHPLSRSGCRCSVPGVRFSMRRLLLKHALEVILRMTRHGAFALASPAT